VRWRVSERRPPDVRVAVAVALLAAMVGCATMPAAEKTAQPAQDRGARTAQVARSAAPAARPAAEPAAAVERRRRDYPQIETTPTGFTITEQVRISGDVRADYDRALEYLRQNRFDDGIALLKQITEKAPDVTAPFIDLGIAYSRAGDLEQAEAALLAALKLSPEHPIAHNELGIVYRKSGRFAEARLSYERALAIYPGFHFANRNLGVLCDLYLQDLNCAREHYEAYMESVVEDADVTIWLADVRHRLGE
jgi:Flp pilus assembly protein TadD